MPQGDKSSYTEKQKRKARHIEDSYEERGLGKDEAERRAWATVNKQDGGGRQSGSGRGHSARASHDARSEAAKKGWETRRKRREAAAG